MKHRISKKICCPLKNIPALKYMCSKVKLLTAPTAGC